MPSPPSPAALRPLAVRHCRHCQTALNDADHLFIDLGSAPPSNAFLRAETLNAPEAWLPLRLHTCPSCALVQVDEIQSHAELFSDDYVYFSSYSSSWLAHARAYVAQVVERLGLDAGTPVFEVASNDGYLLQYVHERGIPCLGIEPTASTAAVARQRGIPTEDVFLGRASAAELVARHGRARLVLGNNVLAHVPDINDFVAGLATLLAPGGTLTLEFPHLLQLVEQAQFDTIYHEHFSYLALHTVRLVLASQGLQVHEVETLPTHGGSLRVWASHAADAPPPAATVQQVLDAEATAGLLKPGGYRGLQRHAETIKNDLLLFLIEAVHAGKTVLGYGAAAKGNTLLNFAGVRPDLLPAVLDASPHKQGRFLPGSRIPVLAPSELDRRRPDYVLVLPWNLRDEISRDLARARDWGARFVTAIPSLQIW
ncbi:MAG: hypothetical protein RIQ60_417 [Pseudomonadota bacterium]|jgi:2-polyprenyl-3-methyl-5-hydroxy-6-metoxy-1,4-benzoquinol methylase